jgi:hypothetical protein
MIVQGLPFSEDEEVEGQHVGSDKPQNSSLAKQAFGYDILSFF